MNAPPLQQLLTEFAAARLALLQRHEAGARVVAHYDFNNAYQYVIAREETHLVWLRDALVALGLDSPAPGSTLPVPERAGDDNVNRLVLQDDARQLRAFVEHWQPVVATMPNARHQKVLAVILGESLEHTRLFEQAASGVEDVLGRRTGGVPRTGGVLPTRWVE